MARFYFNPKTGRYDSPIPLDDEGNKKDLSQSTGVEFILKGRGFYRNDYSKSLEEHKKNPHLTTSDYYQKTIDKNSEKAREMKAKMQ